MSELELRLQKASATDLAVMHALLVVCGEHVYRQTEMHLPFSYAMSFHPSSPSSLY